MVLSLYPLLTHLEEVVVVVVLRGGVDAVGAVQPLHVPQTPLPPPVAQRLLTENLEQNLFYKMYLSYLIFGTPF